MDPFKPKILFLSFLSYLQGFSKLPITPIEGFTALFNAEFRFAFAADIIVNNISFVLLIRDGHLIAMHRTPDWEFTYNDVPVLGPVMPAEGGWSPKPSSRVSSMRL